MAGQGWAGCSDQSPSMLALAGGIGGGEYLAVGRPVGARGQPSGQRFRPDPAWPTRDFTDCQTIM
jgi:hypothetical protein